MAHDPNEYKRRWRAKYRQSAAYLADKAKRTAVNRRQNLAKYGLTVGDYDRMLADQLGRCAICGQTESVGKDGAPQPLSVDHEHGTGRVRGLLCSRCNTAIGMLNDDPVRLLAARDYLINTAQEIRHAR